MVGRELRPTPGELEGRPEKGGSERRHDEDKGRAGLKVRIEGQDGSKIGGGGGRR